MSAQTRGDVVDVELMKALGVAGAEVIGHEEWSVLPEHRRTTVTVSGDRRGFAYLRLPDPPPVAALREIEHLTGAASLDDGRLPDAVATEVWQIAERALAEFDGTAS